MVVFLGHTVAGGVVLEESVCVREKLSRASVGPDWTPQAWQVNSRCRPEG